MKKLNKLLITLPACLAACSPIVVASCSQPMKPINMVEIDAEGHDYGGFTPESAYQTQDTAINLLIDRTQKVETNSFLEDCITGAADWYNDFKTINVGDYPLNLKSYKVGYSEPTFGTTHVLQPGIEDIVYPTISFKQRFLFNYQNEFDEPPETVNIERTLQVDVEYDDVIFCSYYDGAQNDWHVGLLDQSLPHGPVTDADIMFWPHANNINPWSIHVSCTDFKHIMVQDEEDESKTIEINNCQYYTQSISLVSQLVTLYSLAYSEPTNDATNFEKTVIKHIVLWDYISSFLSEQKILPSIQIIGSELSELKASGKVNDNEVTFTGAEIKNLGDVKIASMKIDEPANIIFPIVGSGHKLTIAKNTVLEKAETSNQVSFDGSLDNIFSDSGDYDFSCDRQTINLQLIFEIGGQTTEPINQILYLPQSTLTLTISE